MTELWTVAFPILVVDVANPVLLAAIILALTTDRPFANAIALWAGHTLAYFLFGLLIIYGLAEIIGNALEPVFASWNNPQPFDFVVGLILGLALLWIAYKWLVAPPETQEKASKPQSYGIIGHFLFGAVVNFIGSPFAVPYFAFISELMSADVDVFWNLLVYNLLYGLPFLLVPISVAIFGKAAMPVLNWINRGVEKGSAYIMPVLFALLGLFLVADAGSYFLTGSGLV